MYLISVRPDSICVSHDTDPTYAFDLEGRLVGAFVGGVSYVRGLGGTIQARWRERTVDGSVRTRRVLDQDEAGHLIEGSAGLAEEAAVALGRSAGQARLIDQGIPGGREGFEEWRATRRVASPGDHAADASRVRDTLGSLGIVPPDQYRSLVVQPVVGCPYNRCTFCRLYTNVPFAMRSVSQVAQQISTFVALLGRGISRYQGVFAGDANPFVVGTDRLTEIFEVIQDVLPPRARAPYRPWPIGAFIDTFSPRPRGATEFGRLAALALRRVYVGLESGDPGVLELLGKPVRPQDAAALVADVRQAGLSVGLIVLLGAGGRSMADRHVEATARLLAQLAPGPDDILYLSPLQVQVDSRYDRLVGERGLVPLSPTEMRMQGRTIRSMVGRRGTRVAAYDVRDFVY